jgi:4-hydroxybenzoate polyprenyltransferase
VFAYPLALGRAHGLTLVISLVGLVPVAVFFPLFELSYEVLYDLRDVEGDRREGVRTYPVVHGERTAIRIANALMGSSVVIAIAGYAVGVIPWRAVVMVAAPLFQLLYFFLRRRSRRDGAPSVEAADCIRLTWVGAAMLATYNVWAAVGGPGV